MKVLSAEVVDFDDELNTHELAAEAGGGRVKNPIPCAKLEIDTRDGDAAELWSSAARVNRRIT